MLYLIFLIFCFKKYKHVHKLRHNPIDCKSDSKQINKVINESKALRRKINEEYTHANGKERSEEIHALQVFQMRGLL